MTAPAQPSQALAPLAPPAALPAIIEAAPTAFAAQAQAAVEARYKMALLRPRDMEQVRAKLLRTCAIPGFAEEARYRKPIGGGKFAEGPSIRFAEECVRALGNLHIESALVSEDDERRVIRVTVTDLEANITVPVDAVIDKTVERSSVRQGQIVVGERTNSRGQRTYRIRAGEDELLVKQAAQVSKAMRNAVRRIVPKWLEDEALDACEATLKNAVKDKANIERLVRAFAKLGVPADHLVGYLGHPLDRITPDEYERLRGIGEAIKEGETTWAEVIKDSPKTSARRTPIMRDGAQGYGETPPPAATGAAPAAAEAEGPDYETVDAATPEEPPAPTREPGEEDE